MSDPTDTDRKLTEDLAELEQLEQAHQDVRPEIVPVRKAKVVSYGSFAEMHARHLAAMNANDDEEA